MKKKVFIGVFVLVMCITAVVYGMNVSKASGKSSKDEFEEYIANEAKQWAAMIDSSVDVTVSEVKPINVLDSDEVDYVASYYHNKQPYGYAILSLNDEKDDYVVKQGAVEKGAVSMYENIAEDAEENETIKKEKYDVSDELVEIDDMHYAVVAENDDDSKVLVDNYGNVIDDEELTGESTKYSKVQSIFINKHKWVSLNYEEKESIVLKKYTKRPDLVTMGYVTGITGKYACGVQALLQIAYMEGICKDYSSGSVKKTYDELWLRTSTSQTSESKKAINNKKTTIIEGGGTTKNAEKGFVNYAHICGYGGTSYKGVIKSPSVAWIKDKLEYNRPILMGYGINVGGKRKGHFISVLGYKRTKKVDSGNTYNYLMVYNSWDREVSYLNYTDVDFMDCDATYFYIRKANI